MIYGQVISSLRRDLNDRAKRRRDSWDGDGTVTVFQTSKAPVRDVAFTLTVGGTPQVETTDFTIDLDRGLITFTSAPAAGDDNVVFTYEHFRWRDTDYIEILNDAIDHFKDMFWLHGVDESATFLSVKNQRIYDLDTVNANIYFMLKVETAPSSSSVRFDSLTPITNWTYVGLANELHINPALASDGRPFRFTFLRLFTKGTSVSDDFEPADRYLLPFKYYAKMRFFEQIANEKVDHEGAVTTNAKFVPANAAFNIVEYYNGRMEQEAKKVAPKLPPYAVKQQQSGQTT